MEILSNNRKQVLLLKWKMFLRKLKKQKVFRATACEFHSIFENWSLLKKNVLNRIVGGCGGDGAVNKLNTLHKLLGFHESELFPCENGVGVSNLLMALTENKAATHKK